MTKHLQPRATRSLRHRVAALRASGMSNADIARALGIPVEAVEEFADDRPRLDNGVVRVEIDPFNDPTATAKRLRKLQRAQELGRHAPPSDAVARSPVNERARDARVARRLGGRR